jgi:hypothetical protein
MPYYKFMKLYWTQLVTSGFDKVIIDPVRVEVFRGPRVYDVLVQTTPSVIAGGVPTNIVNHQKLTLAADRTYVELVARTEEAFDNRQYCEDHIDRVVAQLSAILSPNIFAQEVWRGWVGDNEQLFGGFWLMQATVVEFQRPVVESKIASFQKMVRDAPEVDARFTLMSKLFSRAISTPPGEERFLWLWTVLEVFPMKNTTDIRPISEYLARVIGRPVLEVKEGLLIGRLFGARSELVHDGKLPYERQELAGVLNLLEAIDLTIIRALGGLPYAGELDSSFQ